MKRSYTDYVVKVSQQKLFPITLPKRAHAMRLPNDSDVTRNGVIRELIPLESRKVGKISEIVTMLIVVNKTQ